MSQFKEVHTFHEALQGSGMCDTRRHSLKIALSNLHNSVAQMDGYHLQILKRDYPDVLKAVQTYAAYERGLNRFDNID